jgi:hypothetical protein
VLVVVVEVVAVVMIVVVEVVVSHINLWAVVIFSPGFMAPVNFA